VEANRASDVSVAREPTVETSKMLDTWLHRVHRTRGAASVVLATDASVAPEKRPVKGQRLYSFVGL
jgi:hypothetical protein